MTMGRPPKDPADRRTDGLRIPLTPSEKAMIEAAAHTEDERPVTWARDALLRVAKKRLKQ